MRNDKSGSAKGNTAAADTMGEKTQAKESGSVKKEDDANTVTKTPTGAATAAKKEGGETQKSSLAVPDKSEKQSLAKKGTSDEQRRDGDTDAQKKKQQSDNTDGNDTQKQGKNPVEEDKKKPAGGAAGGGRPNESEKESDKKSEQKSNKQGKSSSPVKRPLVSRKYGVVSPPSFMLSEMVQEDAIFSNFQYVALTECDDRVYGYGTLSADSNGPLGDEGMVDFDPNTYRFHLIYCEKFDTERLKSQVDENGSSNDGVRESPGSRERATLAARRVTRGSSSALSDADGDAHRQEIGQKNKDLNEVPWRLLLFGGYKTSSKSLSNELWEFRLPPRLDPSVPFASLPSVGSWRKLAVTGRKPSPRGDHAVCVSPTCTRMYMFGGVGEDNELLNDAYVLTEDNKWIELAGGREGGRRPSPRRCHTLVCGGDAGGATILYLFGGDFTTRGGNASNDLWKYSVKQDMWMRITQASGTPPAPRFQHASAFALNKVWIGGGISPGWFSNTELKDLFGFDVTALCWFQCDISLGRIQRVLSRFRPLAYIPATKSFFIFGCTQNRQLQHTQAAVCALTPVCTMDNLMPLQRVQDSMKQNMDDLSTDQAALQDVLRQVDEKLPVLQEQISAFEQKHMQLQRRLKAVDEKSKRLAALTTLINSSNAGKKLDHLEDTCPIPKTIENTATEVDSALQQVRNIMKTKAAAADVHFLMETVEKLTK